MRRRLHRCCRAVAGAAALLAVCSTAATAGPRRPNVLLISLDTVRADYLTFRDAETAPNMTALARRGTIFAGAVSGTSWTLPAHAQMFTGTPPVLHRVQSDDVRIDPLMPTLTEILRNAGYFTAGFFTIEYLSGFYGFERGFDVYADAFFPGDEPGAGAPGGAAPGRDPESAAALTTSPNVVALARRALAKADPNEPVFLFAHLADPHYDFIPPPPWDTKFDPDYRGDMDGRKYYWNERIYDESKTPPRQIGDRDLEHILSLYRGEIAWTDQNIGELLALLEEHGRLDETLIVITSDHGEEFFEHGKRGHRMSLYEEVLRVPLLIVPPRALGHGLSAVVDQQVSLSDILPTVMDFAGLPPPATASGRSLRTAMYGAGLTERPELSSLHVWGQKDGRFHSWLVHGLRTAEYKLIRVSGITPGSPPVSESFSYYDLVEDPQERHPIEDVSDPRVLAAWRELETQLAQVRQTWEAQDRSRRTEHTVSVASEWLEQLVALGYMEPGETVQDPVSQNPALLAPMQPMEPPAPKRHSRRLLLLCAGAALALTLAALAWQHRKRQ